MCTVNIFRIEVFITLELLQICQIYFLHWSYVMGSPWNTAKFYYNDLYYNCPKICYCQKDTLYLILEKTANFHNVMLIFFNFHHCFDRI